MDIEKYDWADIFRKRIELEIRKSLEAQGYDSQRIESELRKLREGQRYDPQWYESESDRSNETLVNIALTIILLILFWAMLGPMFAD